MSQGKAISISWLNGKKAKASTLAKVVIGLREE
jgi:hypothetical protein